MEQRDYSQLLPTQPPKELETWLHHQGALEEQLLLYKSDWWTNPQTKKKKRKIRLSCTACGEETWAEPEESEGCLKAKGFTHPRTGDFVSSHTYSSTHCPRCGFPVQAKHQGEIHGVYSIKSCFPLTIHKIQDVFALCGWCVMKHFDENGDSYSTIHPYEAYVVEQRKLVRLNGWEGTQFGSQRLVNHWIQRKRFRDVLGDCDLVFPWDPAILMGTTAENSKLDLYLDLLEGEHALYPVAYLNRWLKHKNLEHLLVQGAGNLVAEMLENEGKYTIFGQVATSEGTGIIRWKEKRPAQMLGLDKNQFGRLVAEQWDVKTLTILHFLKEQGYPTDPETHKTCQEFGLWQCREVARDHPGNLLKIANYVKKQRKKDSLSDYSALEDYWRMAEGQGYDLAHPKVRFPHQLHTAHERVRRAFQEEQRLQREEQSKKVALDRKKAMAKRVKTLSLFSWAQAAILIRPAKSEEELRIEGNTLEHCVHSYYKAMERGETAIFFLRKTSAPETPWFTLELDEENLEILQNRGHCNCDPPEEVEAFVEAWLDHIRSLAKEKPKNQKKRGVA